MNINSEIKAFLLNDPMYAGLLTADFSDEFNLVAAGALDSIGIFNLVAHIEKIYGFTVESVDLIESNFSSINSIAAFIEARKR